MPTAGLKPTLETQPTAVIGPLMTSSGFKFWYFVCDSESIIAAHVPFKHGLYSVLPYAIAPMFGLAGGLLVKPFDSVAKRANQKLVAELQGRPNRLKYAPHQTFKISSLRSIQPKSGFKGAGGIGTRDIVLERTNGTRMAFGAQSLAWNEFCNQLKQLYPGLYQGQ